MKKLTTIGLTVLMIAMLLCSCDPSAVNGNEKGASVDSITLAFKSAYSMAAEASDVTAAFNTTQWNPDNFDWWFYTEMNGSSNIGTAIGSISKYRRITFADSAWTIPGTFYVGDSVIFHIAAVLKDTAKTGTDEDGDYLDLHFQGVDASGGEYYNKKCFEGTITATISKGLVIKPEIEVSRYLKGNGGNGTGICPVALTLNYTPSEGLKESLKGKSVTVKIKAGRSTNFRDATASGDGKFNSETGVLSDTFTVSNMPIAESNQHSAAVYVTIIADGHTLVNELKISEKVYTYASITVNIIATITGDELELVGLSFTPTLPIDPNLPTTDTTMWYYNANDSTTPFEQPGTYNFIQLGDDYYYFKFKSNGEYYLVKKCIDESGVKVYEDSEAIKLKTTTTPYQISSGFMDAYNDATTKACTVVGTFGESGSVLVIDGVSHPVVEAATITLKMYTTEAEVATITIPGTKKDTHWNELGSTGLEFTGSDGKTYTLKWESSTPKIAQSGTSEPFIAYPTKGDVPTACSSSDTIGQSPILYIMAAGA